MVYVRTMEQHTMTLAQHNDDCMNCGGDGFRMECDDPNGGFSYAVPCHDYNPDPYYCDY